MRYWPVSSVTAVRTFSISAGLEASTVTPGSTPPDASRTVPVREAWANAVLGAQKNEERQTLQSGTHTGRFPFSMVGTDGMAAASRPRLSPKPPHTGT